MSLVAMEWLLILSAMLSALTGAFTGTREPEAGLRQAEAAVAAEAAVVAVRAQVRRSALPAPILRLPRAEALPLPAFALVVADPLEAVRLIE